MTLIHLSTYLYHYSASPILLFEVSMPHCSTLYFYTSLFLLTHGYVQKYEFLANTFKETIWWPQNLHALPWQFCLVSQMEVHEWLIDRCLREHHPKFGWVFTMIFEKPSSSRAAHWYKDLQRFWFLKFIYINVPDKELLLI